MSVHVVIVSWNSREDTLACLASLERAQRGPTVTVHVVDNGSHDGSADAVAAAHASVVLHRQERNLGFAAGANVGIRAALDAEARWVFLLNNDARVDADTVPRLLDAAARRPDAGLYGGKILLDRAAGVIWCCGVSMGLWPNLSRLRGMGRPDRGQYDREEVVDALTGCGLLVAREVFERIGLLDEAYFVYVEDADFCARARRAGFACLYVPDAVMEHAAAGSTGGGYSRGRKYLTAHGSVLYLKRHGTPLLWAGFLLVDVALFPLLLIDGLVRRRLGGVLAKGRGMLHGFLGRAVDRRVIESR